MISMDRTVIKNLDELKIYAQKLARGLVPGAVVAVTGKLGAGKTTLIQLVASFLGVKSRALSPSFVIFKIYPLNRRGLRNFCHVDLYRLENFSEPHGFEEYLGDKETVCFIEWPEKIKHLLLPGTDWIKIEIQPDNSRVITKTPTPAPSRPDHR